MKKPKTLLACVAAAAWLLLCGCTSPNAHVGIGVPVGPVQLGVGLGSGGVSAGAAVGHGPVGVGVGINQRGQVSGSAGVGASTSVGKARVGAGVGSASVLYDPQSPRVQAPATERPASAPLRWRDAQGRSVSECQAFGTCAGVQQ